MQTTPVANIDRINTSKCVSMTKIKRTKKLSRPSNKIHKPLYNEMHVKCNFSLSYLLSISKNPTSYVQM
jgi:hypothetical protein